MATEKNLKKLTIHKLKKKTYNALAEKPVDELVMLTDVGGQVAEITEASADYVGEIVQYVGETNDTYTNGFFYKCVETDGVYSWTQVNVQEGGGGASLPDQAGNAGKFLTTDGTTASWSDKPLVNKADNDSDIPYKLRIASNSPSSNSNRYVAIGHGANVTDSDYGIAIGTTWNESGLYSASVSKALRGIAIGYLSQTSNAATVSIGNNVKADGLRAIALGEHAEAVASHAIAIGGYTGGSGKPLASAAGAIQIGCGRTLRSPNIWENSDADTFKVGNENGNFEIMSADGTIPTDRYTITPTTAGTYVPKLTIAEDGTATREWGTESGGAGGDYLLKTDAAATYLPLSGGSIQYLTLTNNANYIGFKLSGSYKVSMRPLNPEMLTTTAGLGLSQTILSFGWDDWSARFRLFLDTGTQKLFPNADNSFSLGLSERRWNNVYTHKLNNGADLIVPTEGGTLARIEDINAAVGDISTALTAILGE